MKMVFDLDGTICFKGKPLSEDMVQVLDSLVGQGHEIVFASARPIRDLLPILPAHMQQFPMTGGNGAFVATGGEIISTIHFDKQLADKIVRLLRTYEADYLVDSKWDYAYTGHNEHPIWRNVDPEQRAKNVPLDELNEIVKVVILHSLNEQQLLEELQQLPLVIYIHGNEGIIDISPQGVDKWAGLQELSIEPQQYIAFGNDANDMSMFKHAMRSVCVGEHPALMQVATDKVVNEEQQVILKIKELMLELD
ncbi:HAD family phosphatase [Paenibacillus anaericanus]|uniref:HAD family phosphatase n=1 Tax=Paenibacillus anaericanus TaxID=170367 RepID=A0A3S1KA49_9BACL|nr:HAD family hydrolase [Paenibacillus anaericanus]RUT47432.1 HAD family phosphatase [Paenibacillus anaericanus]